MEELQLSKNGLSKLFTEQNSDINIHCTLTLIALTFKYRGMPWELCDYVNAKLQEM